MSDPIRDLENFGTGGLDVNPLNPEEVRRLGDRHRARRRMNVVIAASVLAVLGAVVPVVLASTGGDGEGAPQYTGSTTPDPTPAPTTTSPTSAPPSSPPDTPTTPETFPPGGVEVSSEADVAKLTGTTAAFRAFALSLWRQAEQYGEANCPDAEHGIRVDKYSDAGFALGGVNDCGGYVALWALRDGAWKEILGTQDEWLCGDLARFDVPEGFADPCYGPKEVFGPDDDYGIEPGMTAAQVRAAGGTVDDQGGGTCAWVYAPGVTPVTKQDGSTNSIGYLSLAPDRGVVALFAQKFQVTPRGIQKGATRADLKKAYPEGTVGAHGEWRVRIDSRHSYRFDLEEDDTVGEISMELEGPQGCYE